MRATIGALLLVFTGSGAASAASVLFDFNDGPQYAPLPLDLTVGGVQAHFSATGQGFSIQNTAQVIGVLPSGFSGLGIVPSSVYPADLLISFPQTALTDLSILFAPQELALDTSATLRITAYRQGAAVGTSTTVADPPGTWPSGTLSFHWADTFDSVTIHYDKPPPGASENWGPIFVADNLLVTPALPGDVNGDGRVDLTDFGLLKAHFGEPGGRTQGDLDGNGHIDLSDFGQLKANFGASGAAVPEPSGWGLALLGAACGMWGLRRRAR
ncbi:MAG: dockerin type I domain-containing protein [Pirellulales bacterium]